MTLENRLHLQCEDPDLLIEFDLPPGTHATLGASPKSEIALPLTGIPPFICTLGRFRDGRMFLAELDGSVARSVDLPDILRFPPYQFVLFHPAAPEPEAATEPSPDGKPPGGKSRDQIATRIRALFRRHPEPAPARETPTPARNPTDPPNSRNHPSHLP